MLTEKLQFFAVPLSLVACHYFCTPFFSKILTRESCCSLCEWPWIRVLRYISVLCIIGGDGLGFHVYDWRDMYICVGNNDSMWRISLKLFLSCFVFVLVWQGTHYWWWLSPLSRLVLRDETLVVVHQTVWFICLCLFCLRWFSTYCCWYVYMLDPSTQPHTLILQIIFDFLTSLGIVLRVHVRNWPNFHFWASRKGSKMSKMPKMPKIMTVLNIFSTAYRVTAGSVTNYFWLSDIIRDSFKGTCQELA